MVLQDNCSFLISLSSPNSNNLRFFLFFSIFNASSSKEGATTHSRKISEISFAVTKSTLLFKATIPPNALVVSHSRAFSNASDRELLIAAPQGLLCFKITAAFH